MLPDFPELKEKLTGRLMARMKGLHAAETVPLSAVPFVQIHEGDRVMMVDEEGLVSEIPMKHHRVTVTIRDDELESLRTEDIARRFDEAARQMAMQTGKTFIQSLEKAVQSVGNVSEYRGKPTADDLLNMLERVDIDFDEHGRPELPTLICGEKMYSQLAELVPEMEEDPQIKKRFEGIIETQRDKWRDRESSRELVG
jgi:predicted DNA-binding protein (UPF0251 family)